MKKIAAKKTARPGRAGRPVKRVLPSVYVLVHELWLETKAIAQREDELCAMLHELRKSGAVSQELRAELQVMVEEMRGHALVRAEDALSAMLSKPANAGRRGAKGTKAATRSKRRA